VIVSLLEDREAGKTMSMLHAAWRSRVCACAKAVQCVLQAIRSLPETDDAVHNVIPSRTIIARDNLLVQPKKASTRARRAHVDDDTNSEANADEDADDDDEDDTWRTVRVLGTSVYSNAAPFLRIRSAHDDAADNDLFSAKEDMRVHPRDEAKLVDLACIAVDMKSTDEEERDEAVQRAALKSEKARTCGCFIVFMLC
jgi:hypothetical protein